MGLQVRRWHARGQGFKSPQLPPRSAAFPAVASYPEFLVLRDDGTESLVRYGPAISTALPGTARSLADLDPSVRRYQFALAPCELAQRREPVRNELVDGTIEDVGGDYLEVAEHHPGVA
jgi:hypothetical protein